MGLLPGGLGRNREFYEPHVDLDGGLPEHVGDLIFDPQTSGGLLVAFPADRAEPAAAAMREVGVAAAVLGEVTEDPREKIAVR
jgi:selenide,water dikinase